MNKRIRNLTIVGVTVVALTAILVSLLLFLPEKEEGEESSEPSVADLSVELIAKNLDADGNKVENPVKEAAFTVPDEEFLLTHDESGIMSVEKYADLPVHDSAVSTTVDALSAMTAAQKVADNSDNQADYGLDAPVCSIDVTYHDDTDLSIQIGRETPSESGSYVRLGDSGAIYILDSYTVSTLSRPAAAYIDTTMMTAPAINSEDENAASVMYSITLKGTSREKPITMRLRKSDDDADLSSYSYILTSPYLTGTTFKQSALPSAMASYTSISAMQAVAGHPTKEQLAEYGLDKPFSTAEISLAVQTQAETGDDGSDGGVAYSYTGFTYYTVMLGNKNEDGYYYAMTDKTDAVYLVSASSVPWAETQWGDVASDMLFLVDITTVTELSVDVSGTKTAFKLTHYPDEEDSDDNLTITAEGKTYPTDDFRTLYTVMMGAMRYGEIEKEPSGTPEITIEIKRTASSLKARTIKFYPLDASLYTCVAEGGEAYTIKKSDVTNLKNQIQNYLDGKAVAS